MLRSTMELHAPRVIPTNGPGNHARSPDAARLKPPCCSAPTRDIRSCRCPGALIPTSDQPDQRVLLEAAAGSASGDNGYVEQDSSLSPAGWLLRRADPSAWIRRSSVTCATARSPKRGRSPTLVR
jgi:hypothetical protein